MGDNLSSKMDASPGIALSFLYKSDPFYGLCMSDLMTASQSVTNQFLKEQRHLTATLKKLEHQQLSRMRQLNEEKKQFALLMKRKLVPRNIRPSSCTGDKPFRRAYSATSFSGLTSTTSSMRSYDIGTSTKSVPQTQSASSMTSSAPKTNHGKVPRPCFTATVAKKKCECGQTTKLLSRSVSCFPGL
ncbi:hypothetical protein NDU88_006376 [Pleurodeles waltl]|uniref:Uncharacterized protein n=1 Tax=Pleurodeles waltl TaxID=8319 RepID=A0AAV7LNY4_PLEWA|nr:hypothetical protein NDU88_006376 [Pleurodeles waltl]